MRRFLILFLGSTLAFSLAGCKKDYTPPDLPAETVEDGIVYLDQGWTDEIRDQYYFTDQGSMMVPYDWFLHLETANSTELLRSDANFEALRYLPGEPSDLNPDGLPVGIAKAVDANGKAWVGPTCALCHTGQIEYQGTKVRIDGGATLGGFKPLNQEVVDALNTTNLEPEKFQRFANNVLGADHSESDAETLREDMVAQIKKLQQRIDVNHASIEDGFGRMDAVGQSFNGAATLFLGVPENAREPDAPVSYPFIWDTPHYDLVEWNGFNNNHQIGGFLARDFGEAMGIFNELEVKPGKFPAGYPSSVPIKKLGDLEQWAGELYSPLWPQDILGGIDGVKAQHGAEIFQQNCVNCHVDVTGDTRTDPERQLSAAMIPIDSIGTDPRMATNFATRSGKTGILEGTPYLVASAFDLNKILKVPEVPDGVFPAEDLLALILINIVVGGTLEHPILGPATIIKDYVKTPDPGTFDPVATPSYRGRSLNGAWATAPYLHNGSVPNLWQLLQKPEDRVQEFYVGSHEFDPVNVGYVTDDTSGFRYDTTVDGNRNVGHDHGTDLSDDEKWALIEYLKSI